MINEENFQFYLRWLVQISNSQSIRYDEIPKVFQDFFSLPALSQALNISTENFPSADWSNVENYINNNSFTDFNNLAQGISENFQTDIDKLYASYYFVTHYIQYDWDRYISNDRQPLSIEDIFTQRKGISIDYTNFFIELATSSGLISDNIQISPFPCTSKGNNWTAYNPPVAPESDHEDVYIDIGGQKFLSEPTFGSGYLDNDHQFNFQYKKSNFLIPYYSALLSSYPDNPPDFFSFEQYASLNSPNFEKELSFESNPFQKITVENGLCELQFSFLQPVETITSEILMLANEEWKSADDELVSFTCLAKDLPRHSGSLSSELRCRYKMTVSFPEVGEYEVKVFLNNSQLFNVFFIVKSVKENFPFGIYDSLIEKNRFLPIVPSSEVTTITNGYARIRFAVKLNSSTVTAKFYKLKDESFEREGEKTVNNRFFSVNLPFEFNENENLNGYLVEDWILVEFTEDGRWEVKIFFENESEIERHGLSYFFDVTGTCVHNIFPIFDLPSSRTFAPFQTKKPGEVWVEPSSQSVILDHHDLSFHVFSESAVRISFRFEDEESQVEASLASENETENGAIKDREYTVTFPEDGTYSLDIWEGDECIGTQYYYVGAPDRPEETAEEAELMQDVKSRINSRLDYCGDIPASVREDVEKLLNEAKQTEEQNDQLIDTLKDQIQQQIEDLTAQPQEQNENANEDINGQSQQIEDLNGQSQQIEDLNGQSQQIEDLNGQSQEVDIQIDTAHFEDSGKRQSRTKVQLSFPSSPRSSTTRSSSMRPPLKKRPIKTSSPNLYSPPVYKTVEITPDLQALKEKAKREEPLLNVSSDVLEDLLYILNQEKKSYAKDHLYKNGLKCNSMIAHVTKYYDLAKKKENQDAARREFTEVNKQFEESLHSFDMETKKLEKELLAKQNDKRNALKANQDAELDEFDQRWNSARKQRTYNHSTNNLNSLRSKLSFLLVEGRFKDAEQVQRQVNERTVYEQTSHSEIMKNDHDVSLKFLNDKQADELEMFEKNCLVELEKFRQERVKLRQSYLNRQLKLKTKEDIIADPNKLWMHGQTERMGNTLKNSLSRGTTINSSSKMKRADIKETDAVVLVLPPLESSRKSPRKNRKPKEE